ncbi:hypothetical protein EDB92DRAFT_1950393 [Lactarius akahatsu]|uniref:Uncharacterized protein n=1 Tax=Lactarius akahatsu TaxID=416441 RepID=A0AAD4LAT3_9AGAM|nr:hypothetical protein EDB92DRAFT_1950393 [Lactarius akahatsu]
MFSADSPWFTSFPAPSCGVSPRRRRRAKEVWRLASDLSIEGEVAADAPPDGMQMDASARAATVYHQDAPLGQFRPWALLRFHGYTHADVRTGSLVQTIETRYWNIRYVDVNERSEVLCISADASV